MGGDVRNGTVAIFRNRFAGRAFAMLALLLVLVSPAGAFGPASVSELAGRLSGAVVNIATTRLVSGDQGDPFPTFPPGSPLRDLFENLNPNAGEGAQKLREARSLGSGFLISDDGFIVTNNHVIEGADEILIFTAAGERFSADIVGTDQKTDLAVLKISSTHPFDFVSFGDSDTAEVGDWVMAIGNPFGLGGSVSLGIVSARNRNIESGPYDDFIQTDAAINLGNSGGPLFDMDGNVVGIVTAIIARGGSSRGIGFAVPVNLAKGVVAQLRAYGEMRRGWLGVGIQEVTSTIAAALGQEAAAGALVATVTPGGPSQGVLKSGDLVLLFDGKPVDAMRDLPRMVAEAPVGSQVDLKILRDGEMMDVQVRLGQLSEGEQLIAASRIGLTGEGDLSPGGAGPSLEDIEFPEARLSDDLSQILGLGVRELTPAVRRALGRGRDVGGVLITHVEPDGAADRQGIVPGELLSHAAGQPVGTVDELEQAVRDTIAQGRTAVLFRLTDAGGRVWFVAVPVDG